MSKLDTLKLKKYMPLYIIGHRNPDVDTVFSSYLLSNILNFFGVESYPCILSSGYEIDLYNKRIIDDYLEFNPVIVNNSEISKHNFVLVDHNDPIQSLGSIDNVVLCIDHHENTNKIDNIILGNFCANSLFIYKLFKDVYPFSEKEKTLVMMATFTDTLFLKTNRYKNEDKILVKELEINLDNNQLLEKYFIETDLSMGIDNYIKKSDRDFTYQDVTFSSSVIQLLNCSKEIISNYKSAILNKNDNHLGILRDLTNSKTYVFFKFERELKTYQYDFVASRTTVLPSVIDYIKTKIKDVD